MGRLDSITFCLCLLLLVFTGTKGQQSQCEDRWFGDKCQYQCHCLNNAICNKTTGECPGVCDIRWFGPQCQYRDAAYYWWVRLTDGDESTCLVGPEQTQKFIMLDNVLFSWMRIVTNRPGLFDRVNMTFLSNNGAEVQPKSPLTKIYISETILELYGELEDRFQSIRLDFDSAKTKQSFCSMYVSSGRNVALKQSASQSSTASWDGIVGGADRAVDGKPQQWWVGASCTFTGVEDSSYWTLTLPLDVTVNVYTILGRNEQGTLCRLRYFRLATYYQSTKVQQYDQKEPLNKVNYIVYPLDTSPVTSVTLSVSTDFWPNKEYICNDNAPRMSFCEMQIYGDVVCQPGKWGRDCEKDCNCQDPCFVSTGMCPSRCKAGFQGHGCQEACNHTTYGEDCKKNCSVNCVVNPTQEPAICGHVNGQCLLGCVPGYTGITCEEIPSGLISSDDVNPAVIVIPIVLVVVLIIAVIIGILFWRRRKAHKNDSEETSPSPVEKQNGTHVELDTKVKQSSYNPDITGPYEMAKNVSEDEVDVCMNTPETQFSKTAISVESLGKYLDSHDMDFFTKQFQSLPECLATTKVADSAFNKQKNRYKNIPAYDHSRVLLQKNREKKQDDYYNANFIQGFDGAKYIASQAPNKKVLADFIRMIWEQDVELVVMLTKLVEDGKPKCESYWPIKDASEVTFGEITVKLAATQVLADYTKRVLQLTRHDGESHFVTQYHFTSWPDKGVPETPWALVDFEQVVNYHYDTEKPLLVHCSAGVGRTGTFLALRNVLKEAKATGYVDFYRTLTKMRQDRIFMIQTIEQYRFLHDAVQVALLCQDALTTTIALDDRMKALMEMTETGQTNIEKEFEMVCDLVEKENCNESEDPDSANFYVNSVAIDKNLMTNVKNRFSNISAKKEHRPKLSFDPENDYINAVLVPSMTKNNQQLLTQLPLPNTVEDFWNLVIQYNVSLIVAFDSDKENQEKPVGDYLPINNKTLECGNFEISGDTVTLGDFWEKEKIHMQAKSGPKNPCYVHHIKCTKSKLDTKDWLVLTKELHSMAPLGDARTLYMCMNGADQSGFACVLSLLLNRVEHDHFLTVPLVVGKIKSIRPEVIPNKDQYCSLYKILQLHCERANSYTNHTPAHLAMNK